MHLKLMNLALFIGMTSVMLFVTVVLPLQTGKGSGTRALALSEKEAESVADQEGFISHINSEGCHIYLATGESGWQASKQDFHDWVKASVQSIEAYYGSFPVPETRIRLYQTNGDTVEFGESTYDDDLAQGEIEVYVGRDTTRQTLMSSWTLTHEMVHLTFPIVHKEDRWLAEGIATYVEPIARMRKGLVSRDAVWQELLEGLPQGVDNGRLGRMRGTKEWGSLYWGGALYCLLADLEIRKKTNNQMGLEDALSEIASSGGTAASFWSAEEALARGDKHLGQNILVPLFRQFQDETLSVDLEQLFNQLGVEETPSKQLTFNNQAPLARAREAILGRPRS